MKNETTKTHRLVMTIVAVVGGLYLMLLAPTQAMQTLKIALDQVILRLIPYDADFYPAVPILSTTFSVWIIAFVLAGAMLLILAKKIYEGVKWARAAALGLFAVPSVAGMTMMIPWFVLVLAEYPEKGVPPHTVSGMPPAMPILFVNLLFYFAILLADTDTLKNKALKLIPFTFLGIVSGMVFMNGQHGVRYFIHIPGNFATNANGLIVANPTPPPFTSPLAHFITNLDHLDWQTFEMVSEQAVYSPQTLALLLGGFLLYIASALLIVSIPLMAMKNKAGWYIATTAALATAVVSFQGFIVRHSTEWLQGGMLSAVLLAVLLIPAFKQFLIEKGD
ncbi:MAG: hypothetical protein DYG87_09595 [Anaerolineae bacterium CFX3]|jgi:hypothetical protein|nr:hypothetical protein [Anaerolineales bacterium]MCC7512278.1 hypothetical protein [Anaerolineae bacterium]MCE7906038.1 hypothetical protein [Anaerolineae bacterium CFX3]OQY85152.1 MAG: hypothetical protein B6D40_04035 [Anaerolineae bacterium UTCFX3]GER80258.1 conserved hypothetical protein [Candidatus Denitrolinea symbiosum]